MTADMPFSQKEQIMNSTAGRFTGGDGWRRDELNMLRDLWAAGATLVEIARRLGRSVEAVRSRARRLCLAPRRARRDMPVSAGRERPCLCCTAPFVSQGPHNRLCETCRGDGGDGDYRVAL